MNCSELGVLLSKYSPQATPLLIRRRPASIRQLYSRLARSQARRRRRGTGPRHPVSIGVGKREGLAVGAGSGGDVGIEDSRARGFSKPRT